MGLISNGTTIFDNGSMASGFGGNLVFISKQTASSSASISFTSGIDSTYKEYVFYFVNMHPSTDGVKFEFNMSTDGGSTYSVTKTTTVFDAYHRENDTSAGLGYNSSQDLAQSTANQNLTPEVELGNDNDASVSSSLFLFNPSSTTFVKHFLYNGNHMSYLDPTWSINSFIAGYGNTVSPINAIKFQMSSGNIDSGDILLYGVN